jgi:hypothetical protein
MSNISHPPRVRAVVHLWLGTTALTETSPFLHSPTDVTITGLVLF